MHSRRRACLVIGPLLPALVACGRGRESTHTLDAGLETTRPAPTPAALRDYQPCGSLTGPVLRGETAGPLLSLAVSGDGRTLGAVGSSQMFWLWDLTDEGTWRSPRALRTVEGQWNVSFPAGRTAASVIGLSGDAAALIDDSGSELWWREIPSDSIADLDSHVTHLALSPDGKLMAVSHPNGVGLYTQDSGRAFRSLSSELRSPGVAFSPDGSLLATSAGELWRTSDWTPARRPTPAVVPADPRQQGRSDHWVAFSPDGRQLVVSTCGHLAPSFASQRCPGPARVLAVADGAELRRLAAPSPRRPVFTADGTGLLAGDQLMDLQSGELRTLPAGDTPITLATTSPDGRIFAAEQSGIIRVFCPR